ncbi:hypothetical protein TNCV_1090011 [Trichonephila clavipes]|uniref:Uncharacterized protein n=1 Tax=Trichonephila clavipes TaxID=2585209 RepID=A0A8X6VR25_TRICX|nr:hypothetical protein TNCV_1090011 [Trichonephila clavipes]
MSSTHKRVATPLLSIITNQKNKHQFASIDCKIDTFDFLAKNFPPQMFINFSEQWVMTLKKAAGSGRILERLGSRFSNRSNNQVGQKASCYQRRVSEDVFKYIDTPDPRYRPEEPTMSMYEKQHEEEVRVFQMSQQSPDKSERPYNQQHAPFLLASKKKSQEKDKDEPVPQLEHRIRFSPRRAHTLGDKPKKRQARMRWPQVNIAAQGGS